jgi:PKD repeat protein
MDYTITTTWYDNSWQWTFGDGDSAFVEHPTHTYDTAGTYPTCLTVFDTLGNFCDSSCQSITITAPDCEAGFDASVNTTDCSVSFTDTSTGYPDTWTWWFGDGNMASVQNPSHTYASPDTYNVQLAIENNGNGCRDTSTQSVIVDCPTCSASFTHSDTGYVADFTNTTAGDDAAWYWEFGDGNTDSIEHPQHIYESAGTYQVCLTVYDSTGAFCDSTCQPVNITAPDCAAGFTSSKDTTNCSVAFTDTSAGNPDAWSWWFGDGNTSDQQHPTHTYSAPDTYNVQLATYDSTTACTDTTNRSIIAECDTSSNCMADFNYSVSSLTANFTDLSSGDVASWMWQFGDGNTSSNQHPSHTYTSNGTYNVCLTVYDSSGTFCDSICQPVTIQDSSCKAGYTYSIDTVNCSVSFTDTSNNVDDWYWDFDDGSSSTQQNPTHSYDSGGTYNVQLTAQNTTTGCQDSVTQTLNFNCAPEYTCTADFDYTDSALTVDFTDQSSGDVASWLWDFDDGFLSTQQHPIHTYTTADTYSVCLYLKDSSNTTCDSICKDVIVTNDTTTACNADFTFDTSGCQVQFTDASSGNPDQWLWDFDDSSFSFTQNPNHTYDTSGIYQVQLTIEDTASGCKDSITRSVSVSCPDTSSDDTTYTCQADFTASDSGLTVDFTDQSSGNDIQQWTWTFGDGDSAFTQNPIHTYGSAGTYQTCLTIRDSVGCKDTYCDSATVDKIDAVPPVPGSDIDFTVYPNPARNTIYIEYTLPTTREITIQVIDLVGQPIATLEKDHFTQGTHSIEWHPEVSAGVYFIKLITDTQEPVVRKVQVLE